MTGFERKVTSGSIMKGSITNLSAGKSFDFLTDLVHRDEQEGTFRLHGSMPDPRNPNEDVGIGFQLESKDSPSGTYLWDDQKVLNFSFIEYRLQTRYDANEGYILLQRDPSEVRVNGRLKFKTIDIDGIKYEVDVIFNKIGMD